MLKHLINFVSAIVLLLTLSAGAQPAFAQGRCQVSIEEYLGARPSFRAPDSRKVFSSLREQGALHLQSGRQGGLNTQQIPSHEQQMQEFRNSGRTAIANHTRSGGRLDETACNPPQAWVAKMGISFGAWAINTIRCVAGDDNFAPIPQFWSYAAQAPVTAGNAPSRDDAGVFGLSILGV
jgi:hypothetical protein